MLNNNQPLSDKLSYQPRWILFIIQTFMIRIRGQQKKKKKNKKQTSKIPSKSRRFR